MKFKTRLWITFVTIIILPVILTSIAFGVVSYQVIHKEGLNYGIEINDYTMWSDSISSFGKLTDEIFYNYVSDKSSNEEHIFTYDGVTESLRSNYYLE